MKYEYCGISLGDDIKDIIEKFDILKIEYKDSMKRLYFKFGKFSKKTNLECFFSIPIKTGKVIYIIIFDENFKLFNELEIWQELTDEIKEKYELYYDEDDDNIYLSKKYKYLKIGVDGGYGEMEEFKDLPHFPRDQIKDKYRGGDICIQACADDAQVAFHAVRNLVRKGRALITLKWTQAGFLPIGNGKETPRNLFGFKDGTENPKNNNDFKNVVWYDKDNWLKNGTFLIVRRIQMHLETWDRTNLQEQENTFGRYKESGAPFGETDEFATIDINKKGPDGKPVLPIDSHVYLAKKADVKIARRAFSYSNGIDEVSGQFDAGLLFICFQKHPDQFIKIQNSLGNDDKLNEYITHVGTGIFACFGGIKKGEYIGQKLFE